MCKSSLIQSHLLINLITQEAHSRLHKGSSLLEVERWLFGSLMLLGQLLLQAVLRELLSAEGFCEDLCSGCGGSTNVAPLRFKQR